VAKAIRKSKRAGLDHEAQMDDPLEAAFQAYLHRMARLLPSNGGHPPELVDGGSASARARAPTARASRQIPLKRDRHWS